MASNPMELIVIAFNDDEKAGNALKLLRQYKKEGLVEIINAAVITKDEQGRVTMRETEDIGAGQGALAGAIMGGLVGLIGGPAGVIVGAIAGGVTGGVAAKQIDMGFPDAELKRLQGKLTPNSSALIALVEHEWVEKLIQTMIEKVEARREELVRLAIEQSIVDQLKDHQPEPPDAEADKP